MTVIAFEGGAGSGKTYRLVQSLSEALRQQGLREGQRVLATTYMHGSRRRLDGKLQSLEGLAQRYECATLDSVAWRWVWRWRTLSGQLGGGIPAQSDFDAVCRLAVRLLDCDIVRDWATASFPITVVDEAQDLTADRLAIIQALTGRSLVILAGDEFQCLQEALRPNPFAGWCAAALVPERLDRVWRTDVPDLLAGAAAVRAGGRPVPGRNLHIVATPGAALAGTFIANQIGWYARAGAVAILSPSITNFVIDAVEWVRHNRTRHGNGAISIPWERGDSEELADECRRLDIPERVAISDALAACRALHSPQISHHVQSWISLQRSALGRVEVARVEIETAVERALVRRRRFGRVIDGRYAAMTIHAAKNREFEGVIVIWPYQVRGNDEQKRRLLYNAITRAQRWCVVLAQSEAILNRAPFA